MPPPITFLSWIFPYNSTTSVWISRCLFIWHVSILTLSDLLWPVFSSPFNFMIMKRVCPWLTFFYPGSKMCKCSILQGTFSKAVALITHEQCIGFPVGFHSNTCYNPNFSISARLPGVKWLTTALHAHFSWKTDIFPMCVGQVRTLFRGMPGIWAHVCVCRCVLSLPLMVHIKLIWISFLFHLYSLLMSIQQYRYPSNTCAATHKSDNIVF